MHAKDVEVMVNKKELQNVKINTTLELANQQRKEIEEVLEQYLVNPLSNPHPT